MSLPVNYSLCFTQPQGTQKTPPNNSLLIYQDQLFVVNDLEKVVINRFTDIQGPIIM